jgi:hypothetical protein
MPAEHADHIVKSNGHSQPTAVSSYLQFLPTPY